MHQIRFRLGLCPISHWGSSQRSPDLWLEFRGSYFEGEGKRKKGEGTGLEARKGDKRKGQEGEGQEGKGAMRPPHAVHISGYATAYSFIF